MAIFEKTNKAVMEFDAAMIAAKKKADEDRAYIMDRYNNTTLSEKLAEVQEELTNAETEARKAIKEVIAPDFDSVRKAVTDVVSESVPADFPATLEAVKVKGEKLTTYEAKAFLEKYKSNYLAFNSMLQTMQDNGHYNSILPVKPDEIMAKIDELQKRLEDWINNYRKQDYYTLLIAKNKGQFINTTADTIQAFIDGGFVHGGEIK